MLSQKCTLCTYLKRNKTFVLSNELLKVELPQTVKDLESWRFERLPFVRAKEEELIQERLKLVKAASAYEILGINISQGEKIEEKWNRLHFPDHT